MSAFFDLTGPLALVTGCNRGIGQAMGLAEAGADIIGVSATLAADGGDTTTTFPNSYFLLPRK